MFYVLCCSCCCRCCRCCCRSCSSYSCSCCCFVVLVALRPAVFEPKSAAPSTSAHSMDMDNLALPVLPLLPLTRRTRPRAVLFVRVVLALPVLPSLRLTRRKRVTSQRRRRRPGSRRRASPSGGSCPCRRTRGCDLGEVGTFVCSDRVSFLCHGSKRCFLQQRSVQRQACA